MIIARSPRLLSLGVGGAIALACSTRSDALFRDVPAFGGSAGTAGTAVAAGSGGSLQLAGAPSAGQGGTTPSVGVGEGGNASEGGSGGADEEVAGSDGSGGSAGTGGNAGAGGNAAAGGSAGGGTGSNDGASFSEVKSLLNRSCAGTFGCHGPLGRRPSLQSGDPNLPSTLRSTTVSKCGGHTLVTPGDPSTSALVEIVSGGCGSLRMPPTCSSPTCIPADDITALSRWIEAGAPMP